MKKIILASQSPRRKELLAQAGFEFDIITSDVEEIITHTEPEKIAVSLARQKAEDVLWQVIDRYGIDEVENYLVIGADTIVAIEDKILGKPKDRQDAYEMMKLLSGRTHQVYTGVAILTAKLARDEKTGEWTGHTTFENNLIYECTDVTFYEITEEEINSYLDSGSEWKDKAGAYGIQATVGAKFVKSIKGDYNNVVGLPVARVYQELKKY